MGYREVEARLAAVEHHLDEIEGPQSLQEIGYVLGVLAGTQRQLAKAIHDLNRERRPRGRE